MSKKNLADVLRGACDSLNASLDEIKRDKDGKFATGGSGPAGGKESGKRAPASPTQRTRERLAGNAQGNSGGQTEIAGKGYLKMREAGTNAAVYGDLEGMKKSLKEKGYSERDIAIAEKAFKEQEARG